MIFWLESALFKIKDLLAGHFKHTKSPSNHNGRQRQVG